MCYLLTLLNNIVVALTCKIMDKRAEFKQSEARNDESNRFYKYLILPNC